MKKPLSGQRFLVVVFGLVLVYLGLAASEGPDKNPVMTTGQLALIFFGADIATFAWLEFDRLAIRWWRMNSGPNVRSAAYWLCARHKSRIPSTVASPPRATAWM